MSAPAVNVTIDGRPHAFPRGTLVIDAVHAAGRPVPYYCFHPKLEPVGACRVCLVQIAKAPGVPPGRSIVTTACTTPVAEGMEVDTMAAPAKAARADVFAFLLANHPLDCPICDKGGECDLQDFTLAYGPGVSRFAEQKILRRKADELGPFLVLDQERCILCQRCVRYEQEVLRECNLVLKERGDRTVIDTPRTGQPYSGYFSGNNTELCPVGALTSRTYRFKARPWDVRPVASVCEGCSLGCNVTVHLRGERVVRLVWRDNAEVDGGWLCDRGRYGFGHTAAEARLAAPLWRQGDELRPAAWGEALAAVARALGRGRAAVLGGARLVDEDAALLSRLVHAVLKTDAVDWRVGRQAVASPTAAGCAQAAVTDLDAADVVVLVDTSLEEEAPVLDLRLRRAAARGTAVLDIGPVRSFRFGGTWRECAPEEVPAELERVRATVSAAKAAVVVWNGRGGPAVGAAVRALGGRLLVPGEFHNARGAERAGLSTGQARAILEAAADGSLHALYLVGCNPLRTFPDGDLAARALQRVPFLVVQDLFLTESAEIADVVLPALGPLERAGHVTNLAGLVQPVAAACAGPPGAKSDGEIFRLLAAAMGARLDGASEGAVAAAGPRAGQWAVASDPVVPTDPPVPGTPEAPTDPASRSHAAASADAAASVEPPAALTPPPASPRVETGPAVGVPAGGRFRLVLRTRLYAGGGTTRFDPNLDDVREEAVARLHPDDAAALGVGDGAAIHVSSGATTLRATLRPDRGVRRGCCVLPAHTLGANRLGAFVALSRAPGVRAG